MRTNQFDTYTTKQIKRTASSLAATLALNAFDREDLEQELSICLLETFPAFDPERSCLKTFVTQVLQARARNFVREHFASKRKAERQTLSLNELVSDGEGDLAQRHETISAKPADFSPEVAEVIAGLAPELRTVCVALIQGGPRHARETTGLSWRQLKAHRQSIKCAFLNAGFDQMGL